MFHILGMFIIHASSFISELMGEEEPLQPAVENESAEATQGGDVFSWPVLRFGIPPDRVYHFCYQFRKGSNSNNFLKGIKWMVPSYYARKFGVAAMVTDWFQVPLGRGEPGQRWSCRKLF
ncbi:uncharacterized protein LOC122093749 isoform X2 [Macadamia integrifolia]|uniref:uncharacterized protein LOC122093749 isoform X2 n=1 Tax=Macadamia integrifolia TaxID=60698 RepID=UPI001C531640|nr:uncharacterized protein LOC122093749 isoform X2 [Macadamia integrifolia]